VIPTARPHAGAWRGNTMPTLTASHFILDLPTLLAVNFLCHAGRRPVAAVRICPKPPNAGIGALGYRLSGGRRGRRAAQRGGRDHASRLAGLHCQRAPVRRLRLHVERSAQLRRAARARIHHGRRAADLDRRFSVRRLRAVAARPRQPGLSHHRELCAGWRLRTVVRARPRSHLPLADLDTGGRTCRL
jgi:hypothetical protein